MGLHQPLNLGLLLLGFNSLTLGFAIHFLFSTWVNLLFPLGPKLTLCPGPARLSLKEPQGSKRLTPFAFQTFLFVWLFGAIRPHSLLGRVCPTHNAYCPPD